MKILRGVDLVRSEYEEERSRIGTPMPLVPAYIGTDSIEPWRSRMAPVVDLASWELPYPTMGSLDDGDSPKVEAKHVRIMDPYHRGRQSLRRLYAYDASSSSTPLSQADAAVQIADWDLLYSHNGEAVARYELTYAMLEEAGVPAGVDRADLLAADPRRAAGVPAESARSRRDAASDGPHRRRRSRSRSTAEAARSRFSTRERHERREAPTSST